MQAEYVRAGIVPDRVEIELAAYDDALGDLGIENALLVKQRAGENFPHGAYDHARASHQYRFRLTRRCQQAVIIVGKIAPSQILAGA